MGEAKRPEGRVDAYIEELIRALEDGDSPKASAPNPLLSSPVWFVMTVLALCINFLLVAVIFWQKLRIDYLVTKIIGE